MTVLLEHKEIPVDKGIVARMAQFCATANVPEKYVRLSMKGFCDEDEVEWVRNFPRNKREGLNLLLTGKNSNPETRCMAITGTLVRNFVDARIMTLRSIIDDADRALEPTVLVVPNLYVSSFGKQLSAWQIQSLYDLMLNRLSANNKVTVAYVESLTALEADYGSLFAEHLKEHFLIV